MLSLSCWLERGVGELGMLVDLRCRWVWWLVDLEVADWTGVLLHLRVSVRFDVLCKVVGSLLRKEKTNWRDMFCPFIDNGRKKISPFT